jgi:REG-2-like HAD superfamily hydrolase
LESPLRTIKGVYFDAGGTLLYPYPSVGEIYALVLKRWGVDLSPETLQAAFRVSWGHLTRKARNFTDEDSEKKWWRNLVLMTITEMQRPRDFEGFFEDLYVSFALPEYWRLHDGALACVKALRLAGLKTGIISNWDHRLRSILAGMPLGEMMDDIIISSEVGCEKPNPQIFLEGSKRWGFEPGELLYVGDSVHHDIEPCLKLGWAAVLIHPHEQVPPDVSVVKGFAEVCELLEIQASS